MGYGCAKLMIANGKTAMTLHSLLFLRVWLDGGALISLVGQNNAMAHADVCRHALNISCRGSEAAGKACRRPTWQSR